MHLGPSIRLNVFYAPHHWGRGEIPIANSAYTHVRSAHGEFLLSGANSQPQLREWQVATCPFRYKSLSCILTHTRKGNRDWESETADPNLVLTSENGPAPPAPTYQGPLHAPVQTAHKRHPHVACPANALLVT